ncbi:hypothetical protein L3Q82_015095 [Scortum barcoo]|uniref:Uncharacterized protein n=1 Tax=Scortum barcoo TaxID=214431 RepID=A0ACB8VUU2_9TELE|nr:hypothetical protein L3Q82_015095 [Scortum barcoo]
MDTLMLEHGVRYGQTVTSTEVHYNRTPLEFRSGRPFLPIMPLQAQTTARDLSPTLKAQGSDPLVHRGELQHMAAELGSYKQAHTSLPPLTLGNSRVVEGPAPLKELGSRAQAMRGGEPDYL